MHRGVPNVVSLSRLTIERRRRSLHGVRGGGGGEGVGSMLPQRFFFNLRSSGMFYNLRFFDSEHKILISPCPA